MVLASLCLAVFRGFVGWLSAKPFSKFDDTVRHGTATIAHVQLALGFVLYFQSPVVKYFFAHFKQAVHEWDLVFFGLLHIIGMFTAIVLVTIGSALAKRREGDINKYRTIAIWFAIALFIIFITIPWPFSPFANRPYFRL